MKGITFPPAARTPARTPACTTTGSELVLCRKSAFGPGLSAGRGRLHFGSALVVAATRGLMPEAIYTWAPSVHGQGTRGAPTNALLNCKARVLPAKPSAPQKSKAPAKQGLKP